MEVRRRGYFIQDYGSHCYVKVMAFAEVVYDVFSHFEEIPKRPEVAIEQIGVGAIVHVHFWNNSQILSL